MLLAGAYWLFGTEPTTVGQVLCAILSSGTLIVAALLATRLLSKWFAIAAVAVIALNPTWIAFVSVLATEHLAGFLLVTILALAILRPPDAKTAVAIGVLTAGLLLTRADIGYATILGLASLLLIRGPRGQGKFALVALLAFIAALAPWTIRNAIQFGEFVPTSANSGFALYRGSFQVIDNSVPDPDPPPEESVSDSPRGYDSYYLGLAWDHIREDPIAWLGFNLDRLEIQQWHDAETLSWSGILTRSYGGQLARATDWLWRVVIVLALLAILLVALGRIPRENWVPIAVVVLASVLISSAFPGAARRHYPLIAPVTLLAAAGAQATFNQGARRAASLRASSSRAS